MGLISAFSFAFVVAPYDSPEAFLRFQVQKQKKKAEPQTVTETTTKEKKERMADLNLPDDIFVQNKPVAHSTVTEVKDLPFRCSFYKTQKQTSNQNPIQVVLTDKSKEKMLCLSRPTVGRLRVRVKKTPLHYGLFLTV